MYALYVLMCMYELYVCTYVLNTYGEYAYPYVRRNTIIPLQHMSEINNMLLPQAIFYKLMLKLMSIIVNANKTPGSQRSVSLMIE